MFNVDNIRQACKKRGITLAELERKLGIGNGVIARWEHKKTSPPYDRLVAIAEYLEVPLSEITGAENPAPIDEDGHTRLQIEAWNLLQTMDDENLRKFIKIAKAILE